MAESFARWARSPRGWEQQIRVHLRSRSRRPLAPVDHPGRSPVGSGPDRGGGAESADSQLSLRRNHDTAGNGGPVSAAADRDARIRARIEEHWKASESGDGETEQSVYAADAILDYPQSGERFRGRSGIQGQRDG